MFMAFRNSQAANGHVNPAFENDDGDRFGADDDDMDEDSDERRCNSNSFESDIDDDELDELEAHRYEQAIERNITLIHIMDKH